METITITPGSLNVFNDGLFYVLTNSTNNLHKRTSNDAD